MEISKYKLVIDYIPTKFNQFGIEMIISICFQMKISGLILVPRNLMFSFSCILKAGETVE